MTEPDLPLETRLAIAYAPSAARPSLSALFALDERLGGFVARTSEPVFGLMRLVWWRDALEALERGPPPADPLLRDLAVLLPAHAIAAARIAPLVAGWETLLDEDTDWIERHARDRGERLFLLAAEILGMEDPRVAAAGRGWALVDVARRLGPDPRATEALAAARASLMQAMRGRWPRALRPLGMLAALATRDVERGPGVPGSRGRMLRVLRHHLTGR